MKNFLDLFNYFQKSQDLNLDLYASVKIKALNLNSKNIKPGEIFIALPSFKNKNKNLNFIDFIQEAVNKGAIGILIDLDLFLELEKELEKELENFLKIPCLKIKNLNNYLSDLAFWFEDLKNLKNIEKLEKIIAVTGTNGKTTVSFLLAQFFNYLGQKTGLIGTLGAGFLEDLEGLEDTGMTTPDALKLAQLIKKLGAEGAKVIAMEASSHALDQGRLTAVPITTAVFTNLTQDHLDYHENMAGYARAKSILFKFKSLKAVVLNLDDPYCPVMLEAAQSNNIKNNLLKIIKFSLSIKSADIYPLFLNQDNQDTQGYKNLKIQTPLGVLETDLFLMGLFNLSNYLAVLGVLISEGFNLNQIKKHTPYLKPPLGRMELIQRPGKASVIIDYAHTPDAMEKVLLALRAHLRSPEGKLWVVFGCGGDRDRTKRPLMAKIAEDLADEIMVTEDNCRFESQEQIRADIFAGFKNFKKLKNIKNKYGYIERRALAIEFVCQKAGPDDLILLAGKGHEKYLDQQGVRKYFNERDYIF